MYDRTIKKDGGGPVAVALSFVWLFSLERQFKDINRHDTPVFPAQTSK
jgi:hypothetical protein